MTDEHNSWSAAGPPGSSAWVGKMYAMLGEGRRGLERGRDMIVGYVETYGRPRTRLRPPR
ncbi:hypothetical protein [Nonomuraea sp. NPDC049709]|uniref:hypothetical protein n=1 Tax=Nonomuraea sp. NPDC049709 TaxID=3154736 RepID=UPI00342CE386